MPKVLLFDNHSYMQDILKEDLAFREIEVVRIKEIDDYRTWILELNPDILVLDMSLSNQNAGAIVSDIKGSHPGLYVILTSVFDVLAEEPGVKRADAFVLKTIDAILLKEKIFEFLPDAGHLPV